MAREHQSDTGLDTISDTGAHMDGQKLEPSTPAPGPLWVDTELWVDSEPWID